MISSNHSRDNNLDSFNQFSMQTLKSKSKESQNDLTARRDLYCPLSLMTLHDPYCLVSSADDPQISWERGEGARAGQGETTRENRFLRATSLCLLPPPLYYQPLYPCSPIREHIISSQVVACATPNKQTNMEFVLLAVKCYLQYELWKSNIRTRLLVKVLCCIVPV